MSEDILSPSKNNQTSDQDKLEVFWKEGVFVGSGVLFVF